MSNQRSIHVFINKQKHELADPVQTGAQLKALAGIPLADVLFLQQPGEDDVVGNDTKITLKNGDHLHSQPPADYGLGEAIITEAGLQANRTTIFPAAGGWSFLVVGDYRLPAGFQPNVVQLLVKLPPAFPDSAPDMFWVHPAVKTASGSLPRATSIERLIGREWQRFSWHLGPGAWKPGSSTLRDFMRCVSSRFLRLD